MQKKAVTDMKVGNNIIKTGMFCLIVVLAAVCGYFVGNHQDINSREDNKKEAEDKFDRRLAVVNMDEGAMQGEEKIYYASQLLPYSGADYTLTGLQDARNGIEIGLYSAYIVIPADFSRSVNSLNEQPAVSRLEYTIAGDLNTAQKEMTAREIERMAENMNDSLTKVYLSSVMQEFHEVQDAGAVILSNDQKDKELLDAVNAGSLIELVEMPGPVRVENDVNPLNLSSVYETDETLTGELGAAYQRFLQEGQSSVEQTKERAGAVSLPVWILRRRFLKMRRSFSRRRMRSAQPWMLITHTWKNTTGAVRKEIFLTWKQLRSMRRRRRLTRICCRLS